MRKALGERRLFSQPPGTEKYTCTAAILSQLLFLKKKNLVFLTLLKCSKNPRPAFLARGGKTPPPSKVVVSLPQKKTPKSRFAAAAAAVVVSMFTVAVSAKPWVRSELSAEAFFSAGHPTILPTLWLDGAISGLFQKLTEEKYHIEHHPSEAAIVVRSTTGLPLTLRVTLTSPLIRDEAEKDGGKERCWKEGAGFG